MNKIAVRKRETIDQLNVLRKNYVITIYRGLCKGQSVREIHRKLVDETIYNIENRLAIDNDMLKHAKQLVISGKKIVKDNKNDVDLFGAPLFLMLTSTKNTDLMHKMAHDNARKLEAELKNNMISLEIETNRNKPEPLIFYVASKHEDCAEDHKDWQGKIYIDEKWKNLVFDRKLKKRIEEYIDRNNIKTFQWVLGRPVWFITRPNCRHFFKAVDTLAVLNGSADSLRELYNLNRVVGDRKLTQTIRHSTREERYTQTNVRNIIKQYEDRLSLHQRLKKEHSNMQIDFAIQKDKLLIKKWVSYYKMRFVR